MSQREWGRVLAAESVSNFGSMLSRLALPWWAALALQATPLQMALLLVADVLAATLGGLLLAGVVDRHGKRAVMLACDGLRAVLFVVLALAAWQGKASMAGLIVASALNGVLSLGFELARSAWMAQRLPAADLPRRNAQLSAAGSLSETLAFALGGWLYQGLGAALALLVDGLSFVLSALCLRGVRAPAAPPPARERAVGLKARWQIVCADANAGLRLVAGHPGLRLLAGIEGLLAAAGSLFGSCFMIFVARDIGFATGPLGMVFAVGGLGALVGASVAPMLGRRLGAGAAMALGLAVMTLGNACVPLVNAPGVWGLGLLVVHQLVGDAGHVLRDVHDRSLRQTLVAPALLARADAGVRLAGQLATLLGAVVGGLIGDALGARQALQLAVALMGMAALLALVRRQRLQNA